MRVRTFRIAAASAAVLACVGLFVLVRSNIGDLANQQILAEMNEASRLDRAGGDTSYRLYEAGSLKLYTSQSEPEARAFIDRINAFQDAFFASWGAQFGLDRSARIVKVLEFSEKDAFMAYARDKKNVDLPHSSGYHDPISAQIVYYARDDRREEIVFHELVHYHFEAGTAIEKPRWNPWFSEGVASLFEAGRLADGKWLIDGCSEQAASLVYDRKDPDWTRIERLYQGTSEDVLGENNGRFYGASELLVFFLLTRHPEGLFEYTSIEVEPGRATFRQLAQACKFNSRDDMQVAYDDFLDGLREP